MMKLKSLRDAKSIEGGDGRDENGGEGGLRMGMIVKMVVLKMTVKMVWL